MKGVDIMVTELEAKQIVIDKKKESPYSCALLENFYIFCMKKNGTSFCAVDKKTGKIYPYSPSLDFIGYTKAVKHVYGK